MTHPVPSSGGLSGGERGSFLTTQRGHIGHNVNADPARASDIDDNRNDIPVTGDPYSGAYDEDDYMDGS